jgi:hypothetical protein
MPLQLSCQWNPPTTSRLLRHFRLSTSPCRRLVHGPVCSPRMATSPRIPILCRLRRRQLQLFRFHSQYPFGPCILLRRRMCRLLAELSQMRTAGGCACITKRTSRLNRLTLEVGSPYFSFCLRLYYSSCCVHISPLDVNAPTGDS